MYRMTIFIQDAQSNHKQQANLEKQQWKHVSRILKHPSAKQREIMNIPKDNTSSR